METTNSKINFPETVMLIDAHMLNMIVIDFKKHFEKMLQRTLNDMDVATLAVNLALDAEVPTGNKEVQVIFTYDGSTPKLSHSIPADLSNELNGVAFQDTLGEFIFASLSPEGMVTREELYLDLLQLISESADVKQLIVVPHEQQVQDVQDALKEVKGKKITLFGMEEPEKTINYDWQMLAYPIMQALGIKGEELA